VRVSSFAFWNEPNHRGWLDGTKTQHDNRVVLTRLYRSLYLSAYNGYIEATKKKVNSSGVVTQKAVTGTQEFIGELANTVSVGRLQGDRCTEEAKGKPKCPISHASTSAAC
jgi:hypothetical protein